MFVIGVGAGVTDPLSQRRLVGHVGPEPLPDLPDQHRGPHVHHRLQPARGGAPPDRFQPLRRHADGDEGDGRGDPRSLRRPIPAGRSAARSTSQPPGDPLSYGWREPVLLPAPQTPATATQSGTTSAAGNLRFVWRPVNPAATSSITVTETVQPGFVPASVTCIVGGSPRTRHGDRHVVHGLRHGGSRQRRLRRPEPGGALDRAGGQELRGRAVADDDLRRRERRGPVRCRDCCHRQRRQRVLLLSDLHAGRPSARRACRPATRPRSTVGRGHHSPTPAAPSASPAPLPPARPSPARS